MKLELIQVYLYEFVDDSSYKNQRAHMYNKILVPLEGTQNDQAVLDHARLMAKNLGASLVLIQLYRVMKDNAPFFQKIQVEVGSMGYRKKEKGEVYLAELERSLNEDGIDEQKGDIHKKLNNLTKNLNILCSCR